MLTSRFSAFILFSLFVLTSFGQNITVDGVVLTNSGGGANNCVVNGYKLNGTALGAGNCVSLTQNTFDAGGMWICDPINLNQSFKLYFEANFDAFNSGDGLAFVLQTEGVPNVLGAEGGGLGYSYGNLTGCLPAGDCIIEPSVIVEFDIWDNSADSWNVGVPALGSINDVSCDHAAIMVNGDQTVGGTIAGPDCLLPSSGNVTDGNDHDICIIWDVSNLEYTVYFDSLLVTTYSGDIRTNFIDPTNVSWGFTAGSGGANQNQRICNVDMVTNPVNPTCTCVIPVATYLPVLSEVCSGEATAISLSSTTAGTVFEWVATDNLNVSGETTTSQSSASIIETLNNSSLVDQIVNYTVTPTSFGCVGLDVTIPVTVFAEPEITGTLTTCIGTTTALAGSGTANMVNPWTSSDLTVASVDDFGVVTGLALGSSEITYTNINGCQSSVFITVNPNPTPTISGATEYCTGSFSTLSTMMPYSSYTWSTGANTPTADVTDIDNPITVTVTDAFGCSGTSPVAYFVIENNNNISSSSITICEGEIALIHGNSETVAGVYSETFALLAGCDSTSEVTLIVNPAPTVSFTADITSGCEPLTVTFTNTTVGNLTDCLWTMSNGTVIPGCGPVTTTFDNGNLYDVTLTTVSLNGCTSSETYVDYIYVENNPIAAFTPSTSEVSEFNSGLLLINSSSGAVNYLWDFGDSSATSTVFNPFHSYENVQGNYDVQLIAYSPLGCTDTAWYSIVVNEELLFYVPNSFTPDGNGFNENFQAIFTSGYDPYDFDFSIFNRWGEKVWETNDSKVGWDGTINDGSKRVAPDGVYTWKIEFLTLVTDERIQLVGHVNVLR